MFGEKPTEIQYLQESIESRKYLLIRVFISFRLLLLARKRREETDRVISMYKENCVAYLLTSCHLLQNVLFTYSNDVWQAYMKIYYPWGHWAERYLFTFLTFSSWQTMYYIMCVCVVYVVVSSRRQQRNYRYVEK